MKFEISYIPLFRTLATGTGPGQSGVTIENDHLDVRMGWAFQARIPRRAVKSVEQAVKIPAIFGWGVHGWNGRWAVNGSQQGAVRTDIEPATKARVLFVPVTLRQLYVSLEQPEAFEAATRR